MSRWRTIGSFVGLLVGTSTPCLAQRVHGTVRDGTDRHPVPGAVVWITDAAGHMLIRSIGGADGRYSLPQTVGSAQIHVLHIGYHPADLPMTAADTLIDIRMDAIPPVLSAVVTTDKRVCAGETDNSDALLLWEQVRSALLASLVARQTSAPTVQLISFERDYEPVAHRMLGASSKTKRVVGDKPYVAARPAWAFASEGYMVEEADGERNFYAPDEDVLLDRTFVETHCLHIVPGSQKDHPNEIGIAFEPLHTPYRDTIVDVNGVLWIDRAVSTLHSLEFKYTALERAADRSGGALEFRLMPNGAPMISRWQINSTHIAIDEPARPSPVRRRIPPRAERSDVRTLGYREEGGLIALAEWKDSTRWHADLPRVTGMVSDETGAGVAGMRVWLRNSSDTLTTDENGRFQTAYVLPGFYTILASDSLLATQGIARTIPRGMALTGISMSGDSHVELRLHPRSEVFPLICPAKSYTPGTGVVLASVIGLDGEPVPNPKVKVEALQSVVVGDTLSRRVSHEAEGDDEGHFVVCGAARNQPLRLSVTRPDASAAVLIERWPDDLVVVSLVLKPAAARER